MLGATALRKLSAVLLLLGLAFIAVGLCDGGMPDSVGAFLPALTATPRMAANPVPRSYLEAVGMNTQYGDPFVNQGANKKRNPKKTYPTSALIGYKVGSRAPATAIRSGTTIYDAYGKNNYPSYAADNRENRLTSPGGQNAVTFGIGLSIFAVVVLFLPAA